jgi:hypothetical protein
MTEQYNAGRRVRTTADTPTAGSALRLSSANRREFLSYALAASGALFTTVALVTITAPDPTSDIRCAARVASESSAMQYGLGAMMTASQTILIAEGDGGIAQWLGTRSSRTASRLSSPATGRWRSIWCGDGPPI